MRKSVDKYIEQAIELFGLDKSPMVGLDICATGVKIMSLVRNAEDKIVLEKYAIEPLAPGVVVEKNVTDHDALIEAIKSAVQKSGITTKKVCVSLASKMSITRTIELGTDLTDKEIGGEIEMGADRYVPHPLHEVNLDYIRLGTNISDESLVDVLLVATKSDNVEKLSQIIEDAGLKPEIIDIDTYALERASDLVAYKLPKHGKNKVVALFDIGATTTTMNVIKNDRILYTREQAFGSQQLVDEVQNIYGLKYDEAITAIKYEDLPKDYETDVLDPFMQTVAQQINRFCQFFFSGGEYTAVDYIFLTGGCSGLLGIDNAVQTKMNVKTFVADPFAEMILGPDINKAELKNDMPRLMNCCGLALRNVSENARD